MSGHLSSRLNTAARGWLQTLFGSAKQSPRDVGYWRGAMGQPRSQWSFLAFCEAVVSGYFCGSLETARRGMLCLRLFGHDRLGAASFGLPELVREQPLQPCLVRELVWAEPDAWRLGNLAPEARCERVLAVGVPGPWSRDVRAKNAGLSLL